MKKVRNICKTVFTPLLAGRQVGVSCLFLIFFLSLILSCSNGKKTYVIGVSQCSEDSWRKKLNNELHDATYLHDNVVLRVVSADDDDKQQMRQINAFIDEDVDLLIVSPNQMNTVTPAIDRAYDCGIPVVLFDRKTDSGKYTAFVGADNEKIGRTIGEYIATRLGGKGTVVEITDSWRPSADIPAYACWPAKAATGCSKAATRWRQGCLQKASCLIMSSGRTTAWRTAHGRLQGVAD